MSRTMNEREKLRKFRELDDAFAQALRELDGGSRRSEQASEDHKRSDFEDRLQGLMREYALSQRCVHEMLSTLVEYKKIS
ncbi:hypothetical protein F0A16_12605 [Salinicola corii]|uniref:Uncharacterized protein n=1 Tax=Salinicola corii TaxID=2606937 RepID=A0A640WD11_9GAMM|nr:hypothetical protein [Salinicola corii]KAA0017900.1 hypothetical protein F0A16_12605 [Salinicola corii]